MGEMMAYVKCGSHRARQRLSRLCEITPWYVWGDRGPVHGVEIPDEYLDDALTIPMVTRWRIPEGARLARPW